VVGTLSSWFLMFSICDSYLPFAYSSIGTTNARQVDMARASDTSGASTIVQTTGTMAFPPTATQSLSSATQLQPNAPTPGSAMQAMHSRRTSSGNTWTSFFQKTWFGNLVAIVSLVAAIIALAWALYSGAVGVLAAKWSAHNDALQSCAAMRVRNLRCDSKCRLIKGQRVSA